VSPIYVALDLETTGLSAERDTIWEIGAVRFRPRAYGREDEVLDTWRTFVNPGRPLPFKIQQLSGVTDADLKGAPELSQVLPRLFGFIGDHPVIGHNIGADLNFLRARGFFLGNPLLDTFELASILLPRQSRYDLGSLAEALGIPVTVRHRALEDAQTTRSLFLALLEVGERVPLPILREINRLATTARWPLREIFLELERRAQGLGLGAVRQSAPGGEEEEAGPLFAASADERPLRPRDPPEPLDVDELAALLEPGGALAQALPGYEHRPPQVEMLRAVARAFNNGEHLLVEAGTGTGKSVAYLLPAIFYALRNQTRVVVSTNTINLQDQLYHKDLPLLQQVLGLAEAADPEAAAGFKVALVKGRSNYLCPRRLNALRAAARGLSPEELRVLAKILIWLPTTTTGDQTELFLPSEQDRAVWAKVAVDADACTAERCVEMRKDRCFFYRVRRQAERAHIIIVNHALLMADVATENNVLPEYKYLIVDEAHHLEEATTQQLSFAVDGASVDSLLATLSPAVPGQGGGLLGNVLTHCKPALPPETFPLVGDLVARLQREVEQVHVRLKAFFDEVGEFVRNHPEVASAEGYDLRMRIIPATRSQPGWSQVEVAWDNAALLLRRLSEGVERLCEVLAGLEEYDIPDLPDLRADLVSVSRQFTVWQEQLSALVSKPSPEMIYWVELGNRQQRVSLHAAPLHVGPLVEEHLFNKKDTVILTSATLRTAGSFDFIRSRLNAHEARALTVGSPFDYEASTLLYLPTDMPEPNTPGYQQTVERTLISLCKATQGRTLVLFTSHNQLRRTAQAIAPLLADEDIVVYEQGDGSSRRQLLENFRTTPRSVLLGTRSFWEGIDVVGEALSCLVIVRLPFAVPTDPIFAARAESMEDPFGQYAVPDAILRFRQGFGRLIRSQTDRGVVVVLDRRIQSKAYGQLFLDSLPSCTVHRGPLANLPRLAAEWIDGRWPGADLRVRPSLV
jgi:ATP-dependent DNA helicase DinG